MNISVLKDITLIDGTGGKPLSNTSLVIKDNIISDIVRGNEYNFPMTATVKELAGCYVIPGLIDAHVHLAGDWSLAYSRKAVEAILRHSLYGGITTVRDMGGDGRTLAYLAREASLDEIESPDCYFSALVAGPPFFSGQFAEIATRGKTLGEVPWMQVVTPGTDICETITLARGSYATGIKIYSDLLVPDIEQIAKEAHKQNMKVWAHAAVMPTRPLDVIDSGVDVITHVDLLAMETLETLPKTWIEYLNGFRKIVNSETIPKDVLPKPLIDYLSALFDLSDPNEIQLDNPCFDRIINKMINNNTILDATTFLGRIFGKKMMRLICGITKMAHEAGVKISTGTDKIGTPEDGSFPNLLLEIETLVNFCEFDPIEAITAATKISAEAIGIEETHGTIEPGKNANLVVLNADPTNSIHSLRKISFVMKNGVIYDRALYSPQLDNATLKNLQTVP